MIRRAVFGLVCAMLLIVSPMAVADPVEKSFGTATLTLSDESADANYPSQNDWQWSLAEYGDDVYINVTCEIIDDTTGNVFFDFSFSLLIEKWQISRNQLKGVEGYDEWTGEDQQSIFYGGTTSQTLSITLVHLGVESDHKFICYFDCSLYNADYDVLDDDHETWEIYCVS